MSLKRARIKSENPGDSDDLLDEKYTDKNGEFAVTGTTRELTDIEPVLYIYHDCDDGIRVCFIVLKSKTSFLRYV
ncbi:Transthyretin-like family protein [Oesophagostomum dentatum]|uniref:Transthyretin-like family protein n=1 Tax=Oesophagostomum dentatum TaxID=61180 RepID=A0A0B1SDJ3_OESDE|nr:Transthyretin-like family protein [Oesophagostomum dentatum]